jgi:hypothetical protein
VVADVGTQLQELMNHLEGRAFPRIIDVLLVGETEDQNLGALHRPATLVQGLLQLADHVLGHPDVDLSGQLDELRRHPVLARLPREVERTQRDAVPAQPGPGLKRMKPKGLVSAASRTSQMSMPIVS